MPIILEFTNKVNSLLSAFNNVFEIAKEIEDIDRVKTIVFIKKLLDVARSIKDVNSVAVS